MGTDGDVSDVNDGLAQWDALKKIVRGVADLQIPASTDWPTAKQSLDDDNGSWKFSSVLVAIVERNEPTILLTLRSSGLNEYSSHVSFPGGRPEASDTSVGDTALREAFEEILLAPESVRVLGCLPIHKTRKRNHAIVPVIGLLSSESAWKPAPAEVQDVFEFPFSALLNPDLPRQYVGGERAGSWYWADQQYDIWGVTAVILSSIAELALATGRGAAIGRWR